MSAIHGSALKSTRKLTSLDRPTSHTLPHTHTHNTRNYVRRHSHALIKSVYSVMQGERLDLVVPHKAGLGFHAGCDKGLERPILAFNGAYLHTRDIHT